MRSKRAWAALALALAVGAAAAATPEGDFRDGERAYLAGDVIGAMSTLRRAAEKGYAPAQALLAEILDRAEFDEEALAWYRKAAEQGNAAAEFGLGGMYLAGEGAKADTGQALFWFTRAAERGHPGAIVAAAQVLMNNSPPDHPADEATLLRWLQRAAELGYVPAMERLAAAGGEQAGFWSERAAEAKKRQAGTPPKKRRS